MTKITTCFLAVLIILNASCQQPAEDKQTAIPEVSYTVVQLPSGWGYSIYRQGKLFIRQENIQAIPGVIPFASEHDAGMVAQEVVKKLKLGLSPRITVQDLRRLRVKY